MLGMGGMLSQLLGGQEQSSLGEAMHVPEQDPYELYEKILGIFAPQFSDPSEEFGKQNRRDAILAAGAALMSAPDMMSGMGAAGKAFSDTMYKREQDEQGRLDLRSREEALARYRGMMSSASMRRAEGGKSKEGEVEEEAAMYTAMLKAYPEYSELIQSTGGDEVALRAILKKINADPKTNKRIVTTDDDISMVVDLEQFDIPEGEFGTRLPFKMRGKDEPDPNIELSRLAALAAKIPDLELRNQLFEAISQMLASQYDLQAGAGVSGDPLAELQGLTE